MGRAHESVRDRGRADRHDRVSTYYVPGAAPSPRLAPPTPARPASSSSPAASYFVPGARPGRYVNTFRLEQLKRQYRTAPLEVLEALARYPEEGADPRSIMQLAELEPGRTVAELLRCRYPSNVPGLPPERGRPPLFRRVRRVLVERVDRDVPF